MNTSYMTTIFATQAQIDAGDLDNNPGLIITVVDGSGVPTGPTYQGTTTIPSAYATAASTESQFQGTVSSSTFPTTGSNPDNTVKAGDEWYVNATITFTATASNNIDGAASGTFDATLGDQLKAISNSLGVVNWSILEKNLGYVPENVTNKGAASGYAPLDAGSLIPSANLPQATDLAIGASSFEGTTSPVMDGVAAVGVAVTASHSDHVHPTDTSKAAAGANSDITSLSGLTTPLSIPQGGHGQDTAAEAITALTGTQTSGYYLRSDGTNAALAAIIAGDVPTLNQNTTGTASNITGIAAIVNGGTGQDTAAEAITALTGTQTSGYYLRSDGTNSALAAIVAGDVPTLNQNTTGTASNVTGVVAVENGGTEVATLALNGVMLGNGTDPVQVTSAGSADQVLRVPGAGGTPAFGAVDLSKSAAVTGLLPTANQWTATSTLTTSTVLTAYQHVVLADSTSGTLTLTLPAPATTMHIVIKKISSTATDDVVIALPSGTIDGAASKTIDTQYESTTITSDGTNYFVI